MQQKGYKIRSYISGKAKDGTEYKNFSLTVPTSIAESLPEGITFVPKMTKDGLLYEPIDQATTIELPDWAKKGNGNRKNNEHAQAA
jgi:hypothetical protein